MSSDEMMRGEENLAFYTVSRPVDAAHGQYDAADGKLDAVDGKLDGADGKPDAVDGKFGRFGRILTAFLAWVYIME